MQVKAHLNKASLASFRQEPLGALYKAHGLLLAVAILSVRIATAGQLQHFRVTQPEICLFYVLSVTYT